MLLQCCLVLTLLVPLETAAISALSMYTIQQCTISRHFMQSHMGYIGGMACLAVTSLMHFWHNDRDFLRATSVTHMYYISVYIYQYFIFPCRKFGSPYPGNLKAQQPQLQRYTLHWCVQYFPMCKHTRTHTHHAYLHKMRCGCRSVSFWPWVFPKWEHTWAGWYSLLSKLWQRAGM